MRRFLVLIVGWLVCAVSSTAQTAFNATWHCTNFVSQPSALTRVVLTPLGPIFPSTNATLDDSPIYGQTDTNGVITFTNLLAGYSYRFELDTIYKRVIRTNGFPLSITNGQTVYAEPYDGYLDSRGIFAYYNSNVVQVVVTSSGGSGSFSGNGNQFGNDGAGSTVIKSGAAVTNLTVAGNTSVNNLLSTNIANQGQFGSDVSNSTVLFGSDGSGNVHFVSATGQLIGAASSATNATFATSAGTAATATTATTANAVSVGAALPAGQLSGTVSTNNLPSALSAVSQNNGIALTNIPNVNPPPLFIFGIDSRTSTNPSMGTNTWPLWFKTNVQTGNFFQVAIPDTNFITIGVSGQTSSNALKNLTNGTTTLPGILPHQTVYFFWDGDINDTSINATPAQMEAVHVAAYNYLHNYGAKVVLVTPRPNQPWPGTSAGYSNLVAEQSWAFTNQGIAWDYLMQAFQNENPSYFGDGVHETNSGCAMMANLALQTILGAPSGLYTAGGVQTTPYGLNLYPTNSLPNAIAFDGRGCLWNSNGVVYLRLAPVGGNTNSYTDYCISGLFTAPVQFVGNAQINAQATDGGPFITLSDLSLINWRMGVGGSVSNFYIKDVNTGNSVMSLDNGDNATFFKNLTVGGTSQFNGNVQVGSQSFQVTYASSSGGPFINLSDTPGINWRIGSDASDNFYIEDVNSGKSVLYVDASDNAHFYGTITATNFSGNASGLTNLLANAHSITNTTPASTNYFPDLSSITYHHFVLSNDCCIVALTNGPGYKQLQFECLGATNHNVLFPTAFLKGGNTNLISSTAGSYEVVVVTNKTKLVLNVGSYLGNPASSNSDVDMEVRQ